MVFKSFLSKAKDVDILSSIPDGIILVETSGKIEWSNEVVPSLLMLDKAEILNHEVSDVIEGGYELIKQAAESFKPVVGRVKSLLGKETFFEITANRIEGYYVASLRDVTQNYKTVSNILNEQEHSKKNSKDKNSFLLKLSNELKSPLQSAIGFSQAMIDGLGGSMSEKQEKYIKIINKNSLEVLNLVNKIIELSKTESNAYEYNFQIFDATNAINSVIKDFESQIKSKNLNLSVDFSEVVKKTVFSDENLLKIILQNVLETSVNSTDIGSINIKIKHPDIDTLYEQNLLSVEPEEFNEKNYLMINISDTGAGIPENELALIFEPYTLLEQGNKKNINRSIALASVNNLVKYLKGSIWIASEPMQGSSYNIILPIEKFM